MTGLAQLGAVRRVSEPRMSQPKAWNLGFDDSWNRRFRDLNRVALLAFRENQPVGSQDLRFEPLRQLPRSLIDQLFQLRKISRRMPIDDFFPLIGFVARIF